MTHFRTALTTDLPINIDQRTAKWLDAAGYNRSLDDIESALPIDSGRTAH